MIRTPASRSPARQKPAAALAAAILSLGAASGIVAAPLAAQQDAHLSGHGSVIAAPSFERWGFGSGLAQRSRLDGTTTVVQSATQLTVPISARLSVTERWQLDVEGAYVEDHVHLARQDTVLGRSDYTLTGASDVRVRLTGPLIGDALLVTASVNMPFGVSNVTAEQARAVIVLGAPALGATVPVPGTGGRATAGLILARPLLGWAWALGASYELRAPYAPGLIASGLPALDFSPSNVVHLTAAADRTVGAQGLSFSASADLFGTDRLRGASGDAGNVQAKLGPIYTGEARLRLAARRFSDLTLYGITRYRSRFTQDARTVAASDGWYSDAGVRAVLPISPRTGLVAAASGRYQTGLAFDASLAAASVRSGSLLLGLARDVGAGYSLQPFVKGEAGRVRTGSGTSAPLTSASAGLALGVRF